MRQRLDPWTELQMSARSALKGFARPVTVADVAERCHFLSLDDVVTRGYAAQLNALKNLAIAWREVPDESRAVMAVAVEGLLNALDAWPQHLRPTDDVLKPRYAAASNRRPTRVVDPPRVPHWLKD